MKRIKFFNKGIFSTFIILLSVLCLGFGMRILTPRATNRDQNPAIDGTVFASTDGDFEYSVEDDEVTITGYTGAGGAVTIPSTWAWACS